jgi:hypothetical protein
MARVGEGPAMAEQGEVHPSIPEEAEWTGAGAIHLSGGA